MEGEIYPYISGTSYLVYKPIVKVELLNPLAKLPTKATEGSACYDLYTPYYFELDFDETKKIDLGFKIELPPNYEAQIRGRSSFSLKGIHTHLGTIDSDYRGEVSVVMTLNSPIYQNFYSGERIAQMKISYVPPIDLIEGAVKETGRGGFGSTGK